jgi:Putative beta-barrel porin-2, OmpL-like. bbp2
MLPRKMMSPRRVLAITVALFLLANSAPLDAQAVSADTGRTIAIGAFVDAAYAFDVNRPGTRDRAFTTQPARHNEFTVNLAFVDVTVARRRVRGRLALQAGTSVRANYAAEAREGTMGGDGLSGMLQEAYAGYQVTPALWIDAGIFYSNMGMETWVSRDNPAYTRSLVADFSPYYSSGVRATWRLSPIVTARVDVVNGWQNIAENNEEKSLGVRVDVAATATTTVSWYAYAGNEPDAQRRLFNGVGVVTRPTDRLELLAQFDAGHQRTRDSLTTRRRASGWYGATLISRFWVCPTLAVVARTERFADSDQVVVLTGSPLPFRANSASVGVDVRPEARVLWRTEARGYSADAAVFPRGHRGPARSRHSGVIVTSLALTF